MGALMSGDKVDVPVRKACVRFLQILESFSTVPSNAKDIHSLFPPVPIPACFQQYLLRRVFHATRGEGGRSAFSSNPQSTASLGIFSKLKESLMSKCEQQTVPA